MADYNTTGRFSLPALLGTSLGREVDDGIMALRDAVADVMAGFSAGTWAARPTPSPTTAGSFYFVTDYGWLLLDDGTTLQLVNGPLVGQTVDWFGTAEPPGGYFLFPDGRTLQTSQYPILAAQRGITDPTFPLTDRRGRVCVAPSNMGTAQGNASGNSRAQVAVGGTGGEQNHTLTASESGVNGNGVTNTRSANVTLNNGVGNILGDDASGATTTYEFTYPNNGPGGHLIKRQSAYTLTDGNHGHTLTARGADSSHNNLQPYTVENCLIRVK